MEVYAWHLPNPDDQSVGYDLMLTMHIEQNKFKNKLSGFLSGGAGGGSIRPPPPPPLSWNWQICKWQFKPYVWLVLLIERMTQSYV